MSTPRDTPFSKVNSKTQYGKTPLESWVGTVVSFETQKEQLDVGWGWRYKVRIMGDNTNSDSIKDENLDYAYVLLPTTAGSGAAFKLRSVRISQGDFVYGVRGGGAGAPTIILGVFPRTSEQTAGSGKFANLSGFYGSLKKNKTLTGEFNEQIGPKTPTTDPVGPKNYSKAEKKEPSDKAKELGVIAGGDENVNVEEKLTPKKIFLSLKDYAQNLLKGKDAVNSKENLDQIIKDVNEKEDRTQKDIDAAITAIKVSKDQDLIEKTVAKEKENKINKLEVVKKETQNNKVFNIFSERYPYVDTSGLKSYADYVAEGVVIEELGKGTNDFVFKYPSGKKVTLFYSGRSNAPTVEERFDALVFVKEKEEEDERIRKKKEEEERKKREEKQRLSDIKWAKRFPNYYNPDGTRK